MYLERVNSQEFIGSFTSRESEVVNGLLEGMSYKLIADRMGVSINTIRKHIKNIYSKHKIHSRGELVCVYLDLIEKSDQKISKQTKKNK